MRLIHRKIKILIIMLSKKVLMEDIEIKYKIFNNKRIIKIN
jgi:hypothetical protein